jgi:trk system potassium uptake protein TrkH
MKKLAVDIGATVHLLATVLLWLGLAFLAPIAIALIYGESIWPYLLSLFITSGAGALLRLVTRSSAEISFREAFLMVGVSWLVIAEVGSLPYVLIGALSPVDAFFEAMSGFTTTGATVFTDIEAQSRALLFWRALTQWLGGMGIIVLAIAILPKMAIGGRQLMDAEVPGLEVEKLTPRIRETAQALWVIYAGITLIQIIALVLLGLSWFDAITHTFTTLSTGGFGTKNASIEPFSPMVQWAIAFFMLVGGTNFALFYRSVRRKPFYGAAFFQDDEFKFYVLVFTSFSLLVFLHVFFSYPTVEEALRHAAFQVASIMTTTGFASTDFADTARWNSTVQLLLFALMFLGASAGSTAGSIKLVRTLLIFKLIVREVRRILHPQAVMPIRLGKKVIPEEALKGIMIFAIIYVTLFALGSILLILDVERIGGIQGKPLQVWDAVSAVASAIGNVGPGFGVFGPMASYAPLPDTSKILLALLMWLGRLEIFPVIVLLTKSYWRG